LRIPSTFGEKLRKGCGTIQTLEKRNKRVSYLAFGLCVFAVILLLPSYIDELKLEKAVQQDLNERLDTDNYEIRFIEKLNKEDKVLVSYRLEGKNTTYLNGYLWQERELRIDFSRKVDD
jgi:hypothetical protein